MIYQVTKALLKKDIALFLRNRFYLLITALGLIFYLVIYFVLPIHDEDAFDLAVYAPVLPPAFNELSDFEGVEVSFFPDREELKKSVVDGDYQVAVALPVDIIETWNAGGKPEITVFYSSSAPQEIKPVVTALIKELSYNQTGQTLDYETSEDVLGPDMLDNRIPLRDRIRSLLAVFILLVEIMTLAGLISVEIEQGTARALLVTPLRIGELFLAKGMLGMILATGQAVLFMLLVGGFNHQPLIMLITLVLGSLMAVGIGFFLAAAARDVMSVTGWGLLVLVILAIPGFGMVIPGLLSDWVKVIPSFYLTDTINRVANYGAGWGNISLNLVIITAFSALVLGAGMLVLRRRYQ